MERLSSALVEQYACARRTFTTKEVARKFRVRNQQAAAAIAILRIKEVVEPADPPKVKGSSSWCWVGRA